MGNNTALEEKQLKFGGELSARLAGKDQQNSEQTKCVIQLKALIPQVFSLSFCLVYLELLRPCLRERRRLHGVRVVVCKVNIGLANEFLTNH